MLTKTEYNLDSEIVKEICQISSKYKNINKVVLFGSRARKDNSPKSDIDLAIYTESNSDNLLDFIYDIENNTTTLLEFDFSNMSEIHDDFFIEQIESEGITLYEKY
ncbi:nucleotidyltransferase domain-containing protein [Clostridium sp. Sa3CUN1]|uniref:Nucleotidyltransferase domain-containing protein n=1 Tax=Clostridium gallinarum TaxID=2762246 RepID=A0ABR8Q2R6_9CLOT|nr:nucleotidyltransferase domain-containing protein [Clostridium gallinarum]MBD7914711.1 nucleotidyltransferase domain-containing protein [Clostridium gallinarum]